MCLFGKISIFRIQQRCEHVGNKIALQLHQSVGKTGQSGQKPQTICKQFTDFRAEILISIKYFHVEFQRIFIALQ